MFRENLSLLRQMGSRTRATRESITRPRPGTGGAIGTHATSTARQCRPTVISFRIDNAQDHYTETSAHAVRASFFSRAFRNQ